MAATQQKDRVFAFRKVALVVMLLCSALLGAVTAQPAQLGIRSLRSSAKATGATGPGSILSAIDVDHSEVDEDGSGYSGPTWMPETEAEHPMCLPAAVRGVSAPVLLHGAAWHTYHEFFRSVTAAPTTPPPNCV
jgi:hypothetical protein